MKNKTNIYAMIFWVFGMLPISLFAQNSTEMELHQTQVSRVEEFFRILDDPKSTPKDAYNYLLAESPVVKNNQNAQAVIDPLVAKTVQLRQLGQIWIPERYDSQMLGKDILVLRFLYKSETFPVIWYFVFYRPQLKTSPETTTSPPVWHCISVRYDTDLEPLLSNNSERSKAF